MERRNYSNSTALESAAGSSQAVRIGRTVVVGGTTATDVVERIVGVGDPYVQTQQVLKNIEHTLHLAGASLKDVIRTRIYVLNLEDWKEVSKAHREVFGKIRPITTIVAVKGLLNPEMLVEIEAEAYVTREDAEELISTAPDVHPAWKPILPNN
ncbi:RidA family protein [Deltaproteobacteria bacterium TL4]